MTAAGSAHFQNVSAPMLSVRGVAFAVLFAVILSWPMLLVTAPLGYFDTLAYLETGKSVVDLVLDAVTIQAPGSETGAGAGPGASAPDAPTSARQLRSFAYSAFLYVGSLGPGGLVLATLAQTTATLLVLFAFFTARPSVATAVAGAGVLAAVTTLPWFASYAMPDILAAALILFYALLVNGIGHIGTGWRITLVAIAAFAVVSHYGHIPLAFGLMISAVILCALRRRLSASVVVLAALPVFLAVGLNLTASAVALDAPSMTPKRLPILLARSIDDGPAAWHLREACPGIGYAICGIFPDGVPEDMPSFLWSDKGIARATSAELDAIRNEESRILLNTFLSYPAEQLVSFFRNTGLQLVSIGTDQVNPLVKLNESGQLASSEEMRSDYPYLGRFDDITFWGTFVAIGIGGLVWLAGFLPRGAGWVLGVCVIGLFGNALIFGGLSAPADRYQSRVIWVLPALFLVFFLNQRVTFDHKELSSNGKSLR